MKDEHGFLFGGPTVARGPNAFHVEVIDPQAARAFYGDQKHARSTRDAQLKWKPVGDLRREDLHRLLDEWLNALGRD